MERISRQAADRAKAEIMMRVTAADVGAKFWRAYNDLRTSAARERMTEGDLRTMAIYRVYLAGAHDGLAHVTAPEYVPDEDPEEETPMEDDE